MITFKQFLTEIIADEKVHHNISVSHLKALVKNKHQVRYSIDHDGKLHAGAASHFIHNDFHSIAKGGDGDHKNSIKGYIEHKDGKFNHHVAYYTDHYGMNHTLDSKLIRAFGRKGDKPISHPVLDKMHAAGINRSHKPLDFEY